MHNPRVIQWHQVDLTRREFNPDHADWNYRIMAEGDSWFTIGGVPVCNVLFRLSLPDWSLVVSLAKPGDTVRSMADLCNNQELVEATSKRFGYAWHAILLSGGGNDLIDYAGRIVLPKSERPASVSAAQDYVNLERFAIVLRYIQDGYRKIVALRDRADSACRNAPIITHTYDYATPNNTPAKLGPITLGPWLYAAFRDAQVPVSDWNMLSDFLLGELARSIESLQATLPEFHVVNTLGTLVRAELGATGESNDWLNEIHPTADGYRKIAARYEQRIRAELA